MDSDPLTWPERPALLPSIITTDAAGKAARRELAVTPRAVGPFIVPKKVISDASRFLLATKRIPVTVDLQSLLISMMNDVSRFAVEEDLRLTVVHRLLDGMPDGEVVLVTHSLGSVATLQMLPYLPPTTVRLLITLGSPSALDQLQEQAHLAGSVAPSPADPVERWLNLVDVGDPVCLGPERRGRRRGRRTARSRLGRCPHREAVRPWKMVLIVAGVAAAATGAGILGGQLAGGTPAQLL